MNTKLAEFKNREILILGFGREGVSTFRFLRKHFPGKKLLIADKNKRNELNEDAQKIILDNNNLEYFGGEKYLTALKICSFVIKSPGIPNKLPEIKTAKKNGVIFSSQTKLFLYLCRRNVVGVTGTKGKSTTSSLINHIFIKNGLDSVLMGNIGKPPLDNLTEDSGKIYVFEMSSHQLSDIDLSPHISVFLNIFPEHLDYYENFDDYFNAKANITKFQNEKDYFVFNGGNDKIHKISKMTKAETIDFNNFELPLLNTRLLGEHNLDNIKAAYLVAKLFNIGDEQIISSINNFMPLSGRLEVVKNVKGVTYIDDGLATIPQATLAAVDAFSEKKITLILGGFDRGLDFDLLGRGISKRKNIKNIILTGQVSEKIEAALGNNNYIGNIVNLRSQSMIEVVKTAAKITKSGEIVLLSPGATSFDMYKDYRDRSDQFKNSVLKLKKS